VTKFKEKVSLSFFFLSVVVVNELSDWSFRCVLTHVHEYYCGGFLLIIILLFLAEVFYWNTMTEVDAFASASASGPAINRNWERAWSLEELKTASGKWTLAADAGVCNKGFVVFDVLRFPYGDHPLVYDVAVIELLEGLLFSVDQPHEGS